eukprot:2440913-Amphidinium_carterae.1
MICLSLGGYASHRRYHQRAETAAACGGSCKFGSHLMSKKCCTVTGPPENARGKFDNTFPTCTVFQLAPNFFGSFLVTYFAWEPSPIFDLGYKITFERPPTKGETHKRSNQVQKRMQVST